MNFWFFKRRFLIHSDVPIQEMGKRIDNELLLPEEQEGISNVIGYRNQYEIDWSSSFFHLKRQRVLSATSVKFYWHQDFHQTGNFFFVQLLCD